MTAEENSGFYVIATEPGHTDRALPVWACTEPNPVIFDDAGANAAIYKPIPDLPGAFQILNLLSQDECQQLVRISDTLGYHDDAPVSLPRHIRHNTNFNWIVGEGVDGPIWDRCNHLFQPSTFSGCVPLGLNARFRFYRYDKDDFFAPHTDGAWPGSRVRDGRLVTDAYGDRVSEMTMLLFLTDGYQGGRTLFQTGHETTVTVTTPKGAALCFPHGMHPQHCVHAGEQITSGHKIIIRTDVLYG